MERKTVQAVSRRKIHFPWPGESGQGLSLKRTGQINTATPYEHMGAFLFKPPHNNR